MDSLMFASLCDDDIALSFLVIVALCAVTLEAYHRVVRLRSHFHSLFHANDRYLYRRCVHT